MTETIGTARLDIVVDTSQFDAAITSAKRSVSGMSQAAQEEYSKLGAAEKRRVDSLIKQADTLGKTRAEQILYNAALKNTPTAIFGELEKKVSSASKAVHEFSLNNSFARRELGRLFSDIVNGNYGRFEQTTLTLANASGLLSLAFSGVGLAVIGVGAVIGTLAAAYNEAENETEAFNKSLILTGNSARTSVGALKAMADQLDNTTSATAGKASDVLAQVAATGKFTADQIGLVSKAAIEMEDATGQSIGDTIKQFESLRGDPVQAILKLNDAQHFLTEETIKQIESLQEQGRTADAAAVAMRAYADSISDRTPQIIQNLSTFSALWRDVKSASSEAFDEVVHGFGDADNAAKNAFASASAYAATFSGIVSFALNGMSALTNAERQKNQKAASGGRDPMFADVIGTTGTVVDSDKERARLEFQKEGLRYASQQARMEKDIADARAAGLKAGVAQVEIDKRINQIRQSYLDKAPAARGSSRRTFSGSTRSPLDLSKTADADLKALADHEAQATESFKDMAATLSGPLASALRDHEKRVAQLNELAKQSPVAADGLSDALAKEADRYAKATHEIERQLNPLGELVDNMKFELDMMGKSNAERATMIALRQQNIDAMSAEGQAALASARQFEQEADAKQKSIDLMDQFRSGAANALTEFVTGAKSAKDALKDFFNELAAQITRAIAEKWIAQAFGQQGSSGGGTTGGGWLQAIMGAFSGGSANGNAFIGGQQVQAFANGGVVDRTTAFGMSGGRFGIMGEAGPEAILPLHRGPDGKLGVRMEASNDSHMRPVQNFNTTFLLPQRARPETQAQISQNQQRAAARATSRNR